MENKYFIPIKEKPIGCFGHPPAEEFEIGVPYIRTSDFGDVLRYQEISRQLKSVKGITKPLRNYQKYV